MSARTAVLRSSISGAFSSAVLVALAAPARADEECALLRGAAREICEQDTGGGSTGGKAPSFDPPSSLDPLSSLADGIAEAAAWVIDQLSNAVTVTSDVDFTNGSFLKTYSLVFAASTFLVLLTWLWAVVKRAVRGVPLPTAMGEAIGLLWLTVMASAFTPLILYTVVSAVDGITEALAGGPGSAKFFDAFSSALTENQEGGPFVKIVLSLVAILAAGVVWLELVVRTALLYVGAALGTIVYSGLVDKALWSRVRKWVGIMAAIILVKPIIVIVLRLASALSGGKPADATAAIVSGLAIIIIAIIASAMIFRLIPGMGDEIVAARRDSYDPASRQAAAVVTKPFQQVRQGMNVHAARDAVSRPAVSHSMGTASSASSGIAAHSTRPASGGGSTASRGADVPRRDDRDGSSNR